MKKRLPSIIAMIAAAFFLLPTSHAQAAEGALSVGTAIVNITPKTPIPMSGYGSRKEPFKDVHDDLFARAVVFSDGVSKAALLSVDLIGLSHEFWEETTGRIEGETGIPVDHFLLAPVHNHDAPVTRVYVRSENSDVAAYVDWLKDTFVKVVKDAAADVRPASIGAGTGICKMNINRRAQDGKGNVTLGRNPYGPCDHDAAIVRIDGADGKPRALLINWPCHGTTLGPNNYHISGDWPGAASRYVETKLGGGVIAPVTAGASGNINPIYGPHIDFVEVRSYSYAVDAIGEDLGKEAIRVADSIVTTRNAPISAAQKVINLPRKNEKTNLQQPEFRKGRGVLVRLSVLKVGTVVFAGISGEVFTEIGMQIKEKSPYRNTIVVTHCNGSSGYLVTDKAYEEGGYEPRSTRVEHGAEKALVDNIIEMIGEL